MATNTRKLASLLGASGAGIGNDGKLAVTAMGVDIATQAELDAVSTTVSTNETDADKTQTNLAILAFKQAVNNDLVKYNLQDQIVDEYETEAGVNTGDSTQQVYATGVSYSGVSPSGGSSVTPSVTHGADATNTDGLYTWYKWTTVASETFRTDTAQDYDYLVVAGGGGGGPHANGGGGGAGGFRTATGFAVAADTDITVTVGDGGISSTNSNDTTQQPGDPSVFGSITSTGGGRGKYTNIGEAGGSGGGGGAGSTGTARAGGDADYLIASTGRQGYDGGASSGSNTYVGGGGGGASAVGTPSVTTQGGSGGAGENNVMGMDDTASDAFLTTVSAGHDSGGTRYFSGGGGAGGGTGLNGTGGVGGGAPGAEQTANAPVAGTSNTGGGGGGGNGPVGTAAGLGSKGGSGIVIIRRLTTVLSPGPGDLILQSSDTTAEAAPTKADMVMLIEDAGSGVGTVNTHIKGWVSRYETGGTKTWTEGVLVDEGDWGTGKRILAFHDLTLTGTSGTQMAYKITTHSASAVYDTKIHATSIGWR